MSANEGIPEAGGPRRRRDPRNYPGSGWVPTSPPFGFPVYGLDASWPGARWLDVFGDGIGDPPRWVALGHQSLDGDSLIMVKTYSRLTAGIPRSFQVPTDAQAAQMGKSPLEWVAFDVAFTLLNLTLPVLSLPQPPGFYRALVDHAEKARSEYVTWPTVRWQVDGAAVTARVWYFAGGWAAFTNAVEGVYLDASGIGTDPDGLALATLQDGGAYHFELNQPLYPGVLSASRAAAGADDLPEPRRQDWHADQLRLMRGLDDDRAE
jgi:hypothetical protein